MRACSMLPALLLPSAIAAQGIDAPLVEGDALPTGALVQRILAADVGDDGAWIAWVDSDLPDSLQDGLLLRDGAILQREGMPLVNPIGGALDEIEYLTLGPSGHLAQVIDVNAGTNVRYGVYVDGERLALHGDLVGSPVLPATARWRSFQQVELDGANGAFVFGTLSLPYVSAMARIERTGAGIVTDVLVHDGQYLPALDDTVLHAYRDQLAVNRDGSFVTVVVVGTEAATSRRAILRDLDTVLAVSGEPSPVAGRRYDTLAVCQVAIDDFGRTAFVAGLHAPGDVIVVVDGRVFARSGDAVPSFASPLELVRGGSLALANSGDVFWVGGDSATGELAVLRNMDVIVRAGVTRVEGRLVEGLELGGATFRVSPDGRFWAGRARFEGFVEALLTADFGLVVPVPGCHGNPATLRKAGGEARAGTRLTLEMDAAQTLGATALLSFSALPAVPGSDCGVLLGVGELLIAPGRLTTLVGAPWNGAPLRFDLDVPGSAALVDLKLFAQGAFVAPPGSPAPPIVLSNALRLEIGAP